MKKFILTRILFLIIFIAIALGLTFYFANKNKPVDKMIENITNSIAKPSEVPNDVFNEKTADLNGTYDINPIDFREYTLDVNGKEINYIQIDGLKDESIEIQINQDIKNSIEEMAKKMNEKDSNLTFYSGCIVMGNFSNVLSINAHICGIGPNDESEYEELFFNYNLVDGSEITIDDVFTSDFFIEEVLVDKLYEAITTYFAQIEEDSWKMYIPDDTEDIEEIVYSVVSDYQRGKLTSFNITPQFINIKPGEYPYARILLYDYAEYITIYDKFLTSESIYDGKYSAHKDFLTFTDLEYSGYSEIVLKEYTEEEREDYYMNIALYSSKEEIPEAVVNTVNIYMDEIIADKKMEERESGLFRIYNMKFHISGYEDDNIYWFDIQDCTYDTTKSKYMTSLKKEIREFFRRDISESIEFIGNTFLSGLNYYEPVEKNGEISYEYHEIINQEDVEYNYHFIQIDEVGNVIWVNGEDNILEIID